jgi:maleamate amidohydrolase
MALLSFRGISTPSLPAQGGQRRFSYFNIQRGNPEFFAQRGFGQRIGFGERPALIIIDMVKAFTDQAALLGADLDKEIAAIVPMLETAHERGVPVIFSTVRYDDADLKDAGHLGAKAEGGNDAQGRGPWLGG